VTALRDTVSLARFKEWARTNRDLALTVCTAKAFAEVERERVDAYVRPIFARYAFTDDLGRTGRLLVDPKDCYLSEDDARCAAFFAECDRAHRAHGWSGPDGNCPALEAEHLLIKAENLLLDALGGLIGMDGFYSLDLRARALDLALGACLTREP
jgi:hypothetical protein